MSNESENETNLPAYPIEWEDVRRDNKYAADDNNNGLTYGIEWMDEEEITDITWYDSEEVRDAMLYMSILQTTVAGRYALSVARLQIEGTDHLMTLDEFNSRQGKEE